MPLFRDDTFLSSNGKTNIRVRCCIPESTPVGVVQIAHGIAEHSERYDAFSSFLAEHGFLTVANDHLGHGKSVASDDELGYFAGSDGWDLAVGDMRRLYHRTSEAYPDIPYYLFGHSMGSFLVRTFLIQYDVGLAGAVICGTGQQADGLVRLGRSFGKAEIRRKGAQYRSSMLNGMAFGSYNKRIADRRTDYDWLSRDPEIVDRYISDPLCGFVPTAGLFTDMMNGIAFITERDNLMRMNKSLPVLFIAGDKDPVGEYGKGVIKAYTSFLNAGMTDVTLKLYHGCRHEILNELCRDQVMNDVLNWFRTRL